MAYSKVIFNGTTLIDLTDDTVSSGSLLSGIVATDNGGTEITGAIATKSGADLTTSGDTVTVPVGYYAEQATKSVSAGTVTNNTTLPSGSTSSGTLNAGSYIKIGAGYHTEQYYLGGGASVSGTLTITDSSNAGTDIDVSSYANVNVTGINVPAGKSFSITVPNGHNGTITFVFTVDASGNTTVAEA